MLTIRYSSIADARLHNSHRFQHATNHFLVVFRNVSVLIDYLSFYSTQIRYLFLTGKDETNVDTKARNRHEISRIRVPSPAFIAALGISIYAAGQCQIFLT